MRFDCMCDQLNWYFFNKCRVTVLATWRRLMIIVLHIVKWSTHYTGQLKHGVEIVLLLWGRKVILPRQNRLKHCNNTLPRGGIMMYWKIRPPPRIQKFAKARILHPEANLEVRGRRIFQFIPTRGNVTTKSPNKKATNLPTIKLSQLI